MAKRGKNKEVRQTEQPREGKVVHQGEDPGRADKLTITWRMSRFDWEGPWGTASLVGADFDNLVRVWCCAFERQTWAEAFKAAGGKKHGTNNHPIPIESLSKEAKHRLEELKLDDLDEVISFRIDATKRLYGIRDVRAFCALWYDPWHGDTDKAVCPSGKRHT